MIGAARVRFQVHRSGQIILLMNMSWHLIAYCLKAKLHTVVCNNNSDGEDGRDNSSLLPTLLLSCVYWVVCVCFYFQCMNSVINSSQQPQWSGKVVIIRCSHLYTSKLRLRGWVTCLRWLAGRWLGTVLINLSWEPPPIPLGNALPPGGQVSPGICTKQYH